MLLFSKRPPDGSRLSYRNGRLQVTSLGHRTKKRGTTTVMLQNVTQKTTSERRKTSRSPEERPQSSIKVSGTFVWLKVWLSIEYLAQIWQFFLPRGVKRTTEATRKPSISPTTITQARTEPKRHQLISRTTPPTTPITADRTRRTVDEGQTKTLEQL